ncbi:glutathione S-transferase [Acuticoccus sp. MNP-M23]|uniref:glutathione S-transferase family protein n=1 Tax=Acuticoccus sp. MNP-M23 TaxID=3072793 RepID=UPI002815EB01|nr:glutathione S-transferase [Acuticoccus sp. MNP-M23]WMS42278.1 glutathione S-transferase [Acuticoccus sp. MNP-M23]
MTDYTLHYWPFPFRGQFVRIVLTHAGASWQEADIGEVADQRARAPADQLVPHMGPPLLTDHAAGVTLAQTGAILAYLGHKHGLMPEDPVRAALTHKVVADANDVLYEMTRFNGAQMWTDDAWAEYRPRLTRWMTIFEELGHRHGLTPVQGHILGTESPGIADFATHALWGVMTRQLPPLRSALEQTAPAIAALSDRIAAIPAQKDLQRRSDEAYGNEWCGGQIEASLRKII